MLVIDNGEWDMDADLQAWAEGYFPWIIEAEEPPLPDTSAVESILEGIGASGAPLTVTLLWDAEVDLDLYFHCDDGSVISYQMLSNEACLGTLDADMTASNYGNIRGDGVQGQIENISVGQPVEGHAYEGKVRYYSGDVATEFQVIFSGTDGDGVLHVYGQEHVAEFNGAGTDHAYSFTYTNA